MVSVAFLEYIKSLNLFFPYIIELYFQEVHCFSAFKYEKGKRKKHLAISHSILGFVFAKCMLIGVVATELVYSGKKELERVPYLTINFLSTLLICIHCCQHISHSRTKTAGTHIMALQGALAKRKIIFV